MSQEVSGPEDLEMIRGVIQSYPEADLLVRFIKQVTNNTAFPITSITQLMGSLGGEEETTEQGYGTASMQGIAQALPPYYFPISSQEDLITKIIYFRRHPMTPAVPPIPQAGLANTSAATSILSRIPIAMSAALPTSSSVLMEKPLIASPTPPDVLAVRAGTAAALISGFLLFTGLTAWELMDFYVIPEDAPDPGFLPSNGTWYAADGFWFRPVRNFWYKIYDLSGVEVYSTPSTISTHGWGYFGWADPLVQVPTKPYPW